jgi:hypothetical protein
LWERGFRYRKNLRSLPGKPDIVPYKIPASAYLFDSDSFMERIFTLLRLSEQENTPALKEQLEQFQTIRNSLAEEITGNIET